MANHTPGPWIARMNCDVISGERLVANCMTGWLKEDRANARLIAAVPESDLLNRDPIGEKQGFKGWLRSLVTRDIKFGEGAKDNEDLSEFDKLPPLRKEVDPLTIRAPKQILTAQHIDGVYGLARFFSDADLKTLAQTNANQWANVMAKVQSLPDEVFAAKPFSRVVMMQALLGQKRDYCCVS